jgi:protein phosphatase
MYENGRFSVKSDVPCTLISVNKGDTVSVIDGNCSGYTLIKKNGEVGWIAKDNLN